MKFLRGGSFQWQFLHLPVYSGNVELWNNFGVLIDRLSLRIGRFFFDERSGILLAREPRLEVLEDAHRCRTSITCLSDEVDWEEQVAGRLLVRECTIFEAHSCDRLSL